MAAKYAKVDIQVDTSGLTEPLGELSREMVLEAAVERAYDVWRNKPNRMAYVREALLDAAGRAYDAAKGGDS